jgi:uncharacterized protein
VVPDRGWDEGNESGEEWPQGAERAQVEAECEEGLPQAVTDIYRFWMTQREFT